jgi:hypothetical protein
MIKKRLLRIITHLVELYMQHYGDYDGELSKTIKSKIRANRMSFGCGCGVPR